MNDGEKNINDKSCLNGLEENNIMENQVSFDEYNERHWLEEQRNKEIFGEKTKSQKEEKHRLPYEPIKDTYYKQTVKRKSGMNFKKVLAACLVVSLFGGAGIGISYSAMQNFLSKGNENEVQLEVSTPRAIVSQAEPAANQSSGTMTAVDVIDAVSPAVVNINTSVHGTTNYYGFMVPYEGAGSGSGVIFSADSEKVYILTNNHVVSGANEVSVSITGAENISATIVGTDSTADLAVISALKADFKAAGIEKIVVAEFGNSDDLKVGQNVIAIGNALGEGKSATDGMISILNKTIEVEGINLNVIQTSAAINRGNSGGALVDYSGRIIGINTAKTSTTVAEAMGYAIPSNTAIETANRLLEEGTTPKPYIGIMGSSITEDVSNMYKLPVGVLVVQVSENGGADRKSVV